MKLRGGIKKAFSDGLRPLIYTCLRTEENPYSTSVRRSPKAAWCSTLLPSARFAYDPERSDLKGSLLPFKFATMANRARGGIWNGKKNQNQR
jgi:hypothetical protein